MELMDYELPEFDLGLNATQNSQLRRVLLVNELLKRAQGAEVIRLLQNIAKNEKENRWKRLMGKSASSCAKLVAQVTGKKARADTQEKATRGKK